MGDLIYLDNAATTKIDERVLDAMLPYLSENYGNPSGIYSIAGKSRMAAAKARDAVAGLIGAGPAEIYFTSSGTEADNWAVKGTAERYKDRGCHIITTKIEHHAVLGSCRYLEGKGFEVTYLDVDAGGLVDPAAVEAALRPDTVLISVMAANNEVGTIEPIREIGRIARAHGVIFHTDAVQAFGHIPIDVEECGIDLLSASAHKIYGPKGAGFLYMRRGTYLSPYLHGGAQERGLRAGTENVAGIVGLGKAAGTAMDALEGAAVREGELRDYFVKRVLAEIPGSCLNGPPPSSGLRLPNNANFCFRGAQAENVLIRLDMEGVCASAGAACASGSLDPSHVLLAMGLNEADARSSVRFTLGRETKREEIDRTVEILKKILGE